MQQVFNEKRDALTVTGLVSEDRLKLFVTCAVERPVQISRDEFRALLPNTIPQDQIHFPVIDEICSALATGKGVEERRVAKGVAAEDGTDGKLVLLVKKFTNDAEIREDERGFVNFRELHLFENIRVGQAVARVYPPRTGKDGVDALGKTIPAKQGKPFKFSADQSLSLEDATEEGASYQNVKAGKSGLLAEEGGKFQVKEELALSKGVDAHVGNVDFIGKVVVRGDVAPGFQIRAGKGIEIFGNVNSAHLTTAEGDIVIKGFIYGGEQCRVVSGGGVTASVAHNLQVDARRDIQIEKEALDCHLQTIAAIRGDRAQFVGGVLRVVDGAEARRFGNEVGKPTAVELCSDQEAMPEFAKLLLDIQNHDKGLAVLKMHLGPYTENPARVALLKGPLRAKMEELLRKFRSIEESKRKLLARRDVILSGAKFVPIVRVNAREVFNAGFTVRADGENFAITEAQQGPKTIEYNRESKQFEIVELRELICSTEDAQNGSEGKGV